MIPEASFFDRLRLEAAKLGYKDGGETLLRVWFFESALDAQAVSPDGHHLGLNQLADSVLFKAYGIDPFEYRQWNATEQCPIAAKDAGARQASLNGGNPFPDAAHYYAANLYPKGYSSSMDEGHVIVQAPPDYDPSWTCQSHMEPYTCNRGLDVDKSGVITFGDIERVMRATARRADYQKALLLLGGDPTPSGLASKGPGAAPFLALGGLLVGAAVLHGEKRG